MEAKSQIRLENIQGLRAIAATMVAVLHAFLLSQYYGAKPIMSVMIDIMRPFGHGGVDIFFVISGFIIVWVSHRAVGDTAPLSRGSLSAAATFALHRVARIYPLFWITLAAIVVQFVTPDGTWPLLDALWANPRGVLLLTELPAHSVSWTLVFEVHFYAIAAVLILCSGRHVARALAGWAVAHLTIMAAILITGVWQPGASNHHVLTSPISMDLAMGALLGSVVILGPGHKAFLMTWAVVAVFVATALLWAGQLSYPYPLRVLVWGVPAMGVLYGVIVLETRYGLLFPAWLRRCGDWSYGIYLWHWPVLLGLGAIVRALGRKGTMAGGWGYVATGLLLTFILAALTYLYVERPIMRWVQRWRPSTAPVARPAMAES